MRLINVPQWFTLFTNQCLFVVAVLGSSFSGCFPVYELELNYNRMAGNSNNTQRQKKIFLREKLSTFFHLSDLSLQYALTVPFFCGIFRVIFPLLFGLFCLDNFFFLAKATVRNSFFLSKFIIFNTIMTLFATIQYNKYTILFAVKHPVPVRII